MSNVSRVHSFLAGLALIAALLLATLTSGCIDASSAMFLASKLIPSAEDFSGNSSGSGSRTFHATTTMPDYGTGRGAKN